METRIYHYVIKCDVTVNGLRSRQCDMSFTAAERAVPQWDLIFSGVAQKENGSERAAFTSRDTIRGRRHFSILKIFFVKIFYCRNV